MENNRINEKHKKERIGKIFNNKQGYKAQCVEYINSEKIIIKFLDKPYTEHYTTWDCFSNGNFKHPSYTQKMLNRIGEKRYNKDGTLMILVEYNKGDDIIVEFQDVYKTRVHTAWSCFDNGHVRNPNYLKSIRINTLRKNKQGCLMKCIEYNNSQDILIEFQDEYKTKINTEWHNFDIGNIKNPYFPSVYGKGIIGNKYLCIDNNKNIAKEYSLWNSMIQRCFSKEFKERCQTYKDVICCDEWLLYENFYEWLHCQENWEKCSKIKLSALDKDILIKGNKIYSPNTCCLVPHNVNCLFTKSDKVRGDLPIGVSKQPRCKKYYAINIYGKKGKHSKTTAYTYPTPEDAFYLGYKPSKETYIKQVAQEEYDLGNITKRCYDAMMNYEVEITD